MTGFNSKKKVTDGEILAVFQETTDPVLTTGEVADRVSLSRRGTLNRLNELVEDGKLRRKKLSKRSLIWWDPRWTTVGERCVLCDDVAEYEFTTTAMGTNSVARLIQTQDGRVALCGTCATALVGLLEAVSDGQVSVDRLDGVDRPVSADHFARDCSHGVDETNDLAAEEGTTDR